MFAKANIEFWPFEELICDEIHFTVKAARMNFWLRVGEKGVRWRGHSPWGPFLSTRSVLAFSCIVESSSSLSVSVHVRVIFVRTE